MKMTYQYVDKLIDKVIKIEDRLASKYLDDGKRADLNVKYSRLKLKLERYQNEINKNKKELGGSHENK